jgi:hypothetical protein
MRELPDHHDAELLLRLYDLRREEKLRRAREWFMREFHAESLEEFGRKHPPGSEGHTFFRMVVSYWEMAASIVNHGLINPEFFFENTAEFWIVWDKIRQLVPQARESFKNPQAWKNLEDLAGDYERWMTKRAPRALQSLRERFGTPSPSSG